MPLIDAFEQNSSDYEAWFEDHPHVYQAELKAIRELLPVPGRGVEIGVGTGRFSAPLGIHEGVEPSGAMAELAKKRGMHVVTGAAERLPYPAAVFDFALMVTTICFLDDIAAAFEEAYRILSPQGAFLIGFVERESPLGRVYQQRKHTSRFYRDATFYTVGEILPLLKAAGFKTFDFRQTLFRPMTEIREPEPVRQGYGEGSFVVIRADK